MKWMKRYCKTACALYQFHIFSSINVGICNQEFTDKLELVAKGLLRRGTKSYVS
jgi:hypothetical protein